MSPAALLHLGMLDSFLLAVAYFIVALFGMLGMVSARRRSTAGTGQAHSPGWRVAPEMQAEKSVHASAEVRRLNDAETSAATAQKMGWEALPDHLMEDIFLRLKNAPALKADSKVRELQVFLPQQGMPIVLLGRNPQEYML